MPVGSGLSLAANRKKCSTTPATYSEESMTNATRCHIWGLPPQFSDTTCKESVPTLRHDLLRLDFLKLRHYDERYPGLLLQPDFRSILEEILEYEAKLIYNRLIIFEAKCIFAVNAQAADVQDPKTKLDSDYWRALINLHIHLLHEHHDFFLASQHPSASPALRRLAAKRLMPRRMWEHGILSFSNLLTRLLPGSIDYLLAFIHLAYKIMALLYETVPAFEDTWTEYLGHLARYRMAIEYEDVNYRYTWAGVARSWYSKKADKNPTAGRLYHHLGILARPNALLQMYYYFRSLTSVAPSADARKAILTLLDPIPGCAPDSLTRAPPIYKSFIKMHALQFKETSVEVNERYRPLDEFSDKKDEREAAPSVEFLSTVAEFIASLDRHIGRVKSEWKEQGVCVAVINIAGWCNYGEDNKLLPQAFHTEMRQQASDAPVGTTEQDTQKTSPNGQHNSESPSALGIKIVECRFQNAKAVTMETFALALRRMGDENVLSHVHVMLVFFCSLASSTYWFHLSDIPWAELVAFLNMLVKIEKHMQSQSQYRTQSIDTLLAADVFPSDGERGDELPLPEDYLIRGMKWVQDYFSEKWFEREHDEEERSLELASTLKNRIERVLRLGFRLSQVGFCKIWIEFDKGSHVFSVRGHPQ